MHGIEHDLDRLLGDFFAILARPARSNRAVRELSGSADCAAMTAAWRRSSESFMQMRIARAIDAKR
jgi:hypothetical protein